MREDWTLKGRHALVCGASKGIGRAAAGFIAELGAEMTLLARSEEALRSAVPELLDRGASAVHVLPADLDDRVALSAALDHHLARHAPIQVWINNTGGPPGGRLIDTGEDAIHHAFGRHLLAAHLIAQKLVPGMSQAGYGRIVSVLSTSVREPIDNLGVSNMMRAAVASWSKTLSRELPPGVTINCVLPGFTATDRLASLAEGRAARSGSTREAVEEAWKSQVPEGRLAHPDELGAVIAFLCSPAASFIRGVSLPVDGGRLRGI